jgi:uncharacterized membrane protein YidH (DUF202 family)
MLAEPADKLRPRSQRISSKRWVMLVAYFAVAWQLTLTDNQPTTAATVIAGFLIAALLLAVVAAVRLVWRTWRWRRSGRTIRRPSYPRSFFSVPVVAVALVIALLVAAGRHLNATRPCERGALPRPRRRPRGRYGRPLGCAPMVQ